MWERGLNFSQSKYQIIDKTTFIPHVRSNYHVSIPKTILDRFSNLNGEITLIKKIKKLSQEGNSKIISFKSERGIKNPQIKILNILSEKQALSRNNILDYSIKSFVPKYTKTRLGSTPIYVFDIDNGFVIGGYYKKDIETKKEIIFDENTLSAIGLYIAEGGKTAASFTNSWPDAINCFLLFTEHYFGIDRSAIKASICCNNIMKDKKHELENYWSSQTGISNFARSLHFNKNVKSHQGILELYFCSETLKEILLKLMDFVMASNFRCNISLIRGILSGDGSPILQTKYVLNHQITFDKRSKYSLDTIFSNYSTRTVKTQPRKIICTGWEENKKLIELDPYFFNPKNRVKFATRFLNLPRTLKENDKALSIFKREKYPKILSSFIDHYKTLKEYDLIKRKIIEEIEKKYVLR